MIVLSLIILAIAIYVKYIRKDFFKLIINNNKLKPSQMYSKCLCFCGGGLRSFYGHYGVLTGLLNQKRIKKNNFRLQINNDILKKFNNITGVSGGAWFMTMLCYDSKFNSQNNNLSQFITSDYISNKIWTEHISLIPQFRRYLQDQPTVFDNLNMPFYILFLIKVFNEVNIGALDQLLLWYDVINNYVFLRRLDNVKVSQPLLKDIDFVFGTGVITDANLSINTSDPSVSYVLQPKGCEQPIFPCNPGPLINNNYVNVKNSNGNAFNRLNYDIRTNLYNPNPNFDNTTFNTCNFKRYQIPRLIGPDLPSTVNIYRCQNVGMAECCRVNSKINQCPNTVPCVISNNEKLKFFTKNTLTGNIQYAAYNYLTEKEPTGEYDLTNNIINSNSKRVYLDHSFNIDSINNEFNTQNEYVKNASIVSSSFGSALSPCFLKNALYAGFSDQELLVNKFISVSGVYQTQLFELNNKNRKIINNTCSIPDVCNDNFNNASKLSWNTILNKMKDKLIVRSADGGNTDSSGLYYAIKNHQSKYGNNGKMDAIVFLTVNFDVNSKPNDIDDPRFSNYTSYLRCLFRNYVCVQNRPQVYDINSKAVLNDLPVQLKSIINDIANYNVLQEAVIIVGGIASLVVVTSLLSLLTPIIGYALAVTLLPFISGFIYEALDLDSDFHLTVDNDGKIFDSYSVLFPVPKILDTDFDRPFKLSTMIKKNNDKVQMNMVHYKNVELLNNDFLEIKKGIVIENLYFIQTFYDNIYSKLPAEFTTESLRLYKDQVGYTFDAFNDCMRLNNNFQSIFELL